MKLDINFVIITFCVIVVAVCVNSAKVVLPVFVLDCSCHNVMVPLLILFVISVCLSSDPYVRVSLCSNTRDYAYSRKQTKTIKKV